MANKKPNKLLKALILVCSVVLVLVIIAAIYLGNYYHAIDVEKYLVSNNEVSITNNNGVYYFDGPGDEYAFIFYPGAKVESTSYAPIMYELSQRGIDCFIVTMPGNVAFLGQNKATDILNNYDYDHWYIGGHSLGGYSASSYAYKHSDRFEGMILLSSYVLDDFTNTDLSVISIYGSNDEVLSMDSLDKSHELMPEQFYELEIEGGNHAYMGSYGEQRGDGTATITPEEQWLLVANTITNRIIPIDISDITPLSLDSYHPDEPPTVYEQ